MWLRHSRPFLWDTLYDSSAAGCSSVPRSLSLHRCRELPRAKRERKKEGLLLLRHLNVQRCYFFLPFSQQQRGCQEREGRRRRRIINFLLGGGGGRTKGNVVSERKKNRRRSHRSQLARVFQEEENKNLGKQASKQEREGGREGCLRMCFRNDERYEKHKIHTKNVAVDWLMRTISPSTKKTLLEYSD